MTTDRKLYEEMYARQLAEGHDLETAMRFNKAATPEDFRRAFGESSDPRHQHRKWGGGSKMGSAGAAVNAARRARAEAKRSAPDANVNKYTNENLADRLGLGRFFSKIDAQVNDTQGKPMPSNPSFVGAAANPGFESIGTRVGNFLSGMNLGDQSSVHSHSLDGSLLAGGIPYGTPGADDPFADHDDSPLDMDDDSDFPADLFGIGDIRV